MIGILTYHFAYNYGAALQAFALQKFLKDNGQDSRIINYVPYKIAAAYHFKAEDFTNLRKILIYLYRMKQYKLFDMFNSSFLSRGAAICTDLKKECENCSALIAGSDQVWNVELNGNDKNYFLDFANKEQKRIAYAVSVGSNDIFLKHIDSIVGYLNEFHAISFREESTFFLAKKFIKSNCDMEAVVDPVFLISLDEWRKLEIKPKTAIPKNYILYYALTESKELAETAIELSKSKGLPVLSVHPVCKKWRFGCRNLTNVGPLEFLWLMDHADFVCTNSYHGSAFSIIFEKKLMPYAHEKLGDRNMQLLKWLDVNPDAFGTMINTKDCNKDSLIHSIYKSKSFLLRNIQ